MSALHQLRIIVTVTGGIAAYKSAELIRRLQDQGADVRVIMTEAAQQFITPLTLQALSGHPVHCDLLDPEAEAGMGHIELAKWADLVVIAPATADSISQLVAGAGSHLFTAVLLACTAPTLLAPAMNQAMWRDKRTQANIRQLSDLGYLTVGPAQGAQACGDIGPGRMAEVDAIVDASIKIFAKGPLLGKKVCITAGPTQEAIDPVRYISNHSSGKMGYALASACVQAGAQVVLISGPVNIPVPPRVECVPVISAADMYAAVHDKIDQQDIFIGTAAVADYRPKHQQTQKLKKKNQDPELTLMLTENQDIIASVAQLKNKPYVVGFAAETQDVLGYAKAKLLRKKLDLIIANDVSDQNIGFNSDNNAVTVVSQEHAVELPLQDKLQIARQIVEHIATGYNNAKN